MQISDGGSTATFVGNGRVGVKSAVAAAQGSNAFFYFEAKRSQSADIAVGVSVTAAELPGSSGQFETRADTLLIGDDQASTLDYDNSALSEDPPRLSPMVVTAQVGGGTDFGFAVDVRGNYPVVWVVGAASANPVACAPLTGNTPCVLWRRQLSAPAASMSIYAQGVGNGTTGPQVTLNTGSDLAARPFVYSMDAVRTALRMASYAGDRGLIAQWPGTSGIAAEPQLVRAGHARAVIRQGDTAPTPDALMVAPSNVGTGSVEWKDEQGIGRGSGSSLPLTSAMITALSVGEHTLTASATNPATGRYAEVSYQVLVLGSGANGDDDGDGLSYDQEKALGLDPGNPDSDGDGLSDGAEQGLGKNPAVPDNGGSSPVTLLAEPGVTSKGLAIADDGLSVAFGNDLNQECAQRQGIFSSNVYSSPYGPFEHCFKRAVRANVGIAPGEFRYFETRRLGNASNIGHGVMVAGAQIDPFCCYVVPGEPAYPYSGTPPSVAINSVGGVFVNLTNDGTFPGLPTFSPAMDLSMTQYYGFAVDYRGADPVVYLVGTDAGGAMTVSTGYALAGVNGGSLMPMLYGHPIDSRQPLAAINFGLQRFHYELPALRATLAARGAVAAATALVPGVGIHRWP